MEIKKTFGIPCGRNSVNTLRLAESSATHTNLEFTKPLIGWPFFRPNQPTVKYTTRIRWTFVTHTHTPYIVLKVMITVQKNSFISKDFFGDEKTPSDNVPVSSAAIFFFFITVPRMEPHGEGLNSTARGHAGQTPRKGPHPGDGWKQNFGSISSPNTSRTPLPSSSLGCLRIYAPPGP